MEWRQVETLTPEHGQVLGCNPGCGFEIIHKSSSGDLYAGAFSAGWVTHWMPLPPPPHKGEDV